MRLPSFAPSDVLARIQERLFDRVRIDATWEPSVRAAAAQGTLVYALRTASLVDFLALGGVARRRGLPAVELGDDVTPIVDLPQPFGLRWAAGNPQARLARALSAGRSPVVFLKRAAGPMETLVARRTARHGLAEGDEGLAALIAGQRRASTDLVIVPVLFLWTVSSEDRGPSVVDALFGRQDMPGGLRALLQAAFAYQHGALRAGAPLSLRTFLEQQSDGSGEDDAALVRRLTYTLLARLERERRAIVGPARKGADRVREEVLRSPRLRKAIADVAGPDPAERAVANGRASEMLSALVSDPDPRLTRALEPLLDALASRVFSGIDVDAEGMDRVREASRAGVVVFLPSHKSHVDYLLLSWALRKHWLELPLVAAGDNLSFFPIGALLRRGGAFFIRRNFRGDRLYAAVVDAYLRRLLRDGWALELFLEGGRSRTGKLRPPQVGLLNLIVDAALGLEGREVHFVPVSIGYERMLEEVELSREKEGGEKRREDAGALLDAVAVLGEPWGRANVQVGKIVSLQETRAQLGLPASGPLLPAKRRSLVHRIAFQSMREINRVTCVTAGSLVAMTLLGAEGRGLAQGELLDGCSRSFALARHAGARVAPSLVTAGGAMREAAITDALSVFARGKLVERARRSEPRAERFWMVPDAARPKLDLSKNACVHLFVDRALVALVLLAAPAGEMPRARLAEEVFALARLFKHEFLFRTEIPYDEVFAQGLADMVTWGEVTIEGEIARPGPGRLGAEGRAWLLSHARALAAFVEAYRVAARSLRTLVGTPRSEKDLATRALRDGRAMFVAREIERREALSKPLFEAAFASFLDAGILQRAKGEEMALTESHASLAAVGEVEARLARLVPRWEPRS